ncbi:hypothetical protein CTEN210_01452 [Chaetoceros tenuissimus]|uniref:Uncharacterized protein n=1 Tax=Chaetoceros tenuissimus TaxID=426638 RepID=A0AAD3CFN1_9STRA|nr:hypothetical protein CTEN210_01452 [Chaetoceros tenuissimus]
MKVYGALVLLAAASTEAFAPSSMNAREVVTSLNAKNDMSRQDFFSVAIASSVASAAFFQPEVAEARGRATLEYAYDRYYPRLEAGGQFYANDLKKAIERNDWAAIKAATAEPPKRTKQDKAKIDGGIAERAAQAGGFSNARVIAAADLWAASFSDNSISPKTKKMKDQTAILAEVVDRMNTIAKIGLGEEKPSGGFLGFGAKAPSQAELAKEIRELYMKGGNAWNQYIFLANDDLPVQLKRLPYL